MLWLTVATVVVYVVAIFLVGSGLHGKGVVRRLRRLLAAGLWVLVGVALTGFLALQHAFHAFTGETLIATVETRVIAPETFELVYTPADVATTIKTFRLAGDQWSISGGIVKWHPWLTFLGLKSYQKPMRISGQFSRIDAQRTHLPAVEPLEPSTDWVWETFYWIGRHLPLVHAVYGSSAYAYVEPGVVQAIYVTPSGYLINSAPSNQ